MAFSVIPGRLSYLPLAARRPPGGGAAQPPPTPPDTPSEAYLPMDDFCTYFPFFIDFGPVCLSRLHRFCTELSARLRDRANAARHLHLVSGAHMHRRANCVYLIAAHGVLCRGLSPEEALRPFAAMSPPLAPWHDASPYVDTFHLTTLDVLRGVARARDSGFFSMEEFNPEAYEHYEQVANGDMNWLVEGRFLALAGPVDGAQDTAEDGEGYHLTTVAELLPVFRELRVTSLVRLNKKYYDERRFVAAGVAHLDLYFLDGSNPPPAVLQKFLQFCEATPGEEKGGRGGGGFLELRFSPPLNHSHTHTHHTHAPRSHARARAVCPPPSPQAPSRCTARRAWGARAPALGRIS